MKRLETLQDELQRRQIDALMAVLPEDILALTGFWPRYWPSATLVFPRDLPVIIAGDTDVENIPPNYSGELVTYDFDQQEVFFNILRRLTCNARINKLGAELGFKTIAGGHVGGEMFAPSKFFWERVETECGGVKLVDVTSLLMRLRMVKEDFEIAKIRTCVNIALSALEQVHQELTPGVREIELAAAIEQVFQTAAIVKAKARTGRAFVFVMSGPRAGDKTAWGPYNISTGRCIRETDVVLVEMDAFIDGYWVDLSRTWICGECNPQWQHLYKFVEDLQSRVAAYIRAGIHVRDVENFFRDALREAPSGSFCPHGVGHGVGFAFHEEPRLDAPNSEIVIETGMVLALEPALYVSGRGGIRLEDLFVVSNQGCEKL